MFIDIRRIYVISSFMIIEIEGSVNKTSWEIQIYKR